jgi:alkanesulfonate monooxygenase SsuD/methylene tetrahydromethanopterin reductase-like flavin-dependent oxidoreductase (luciferase family)
MRVEFGIWDHFERRPGIAVADQFAQKIDLLQAAEQLGFRAYHIAEHHLTPLDLAPSPTVFLAALAQATKRLRVGSMVHCLPLYHPVRLVQEICMLDQISNGRFDLGVGRGIRSVEHEWFGIDPEESRARHGEILEFVVAALSTGNIAHSGRFYHFPDAALDVRTVQQPYPPLWYAGGTEFAGRHRLNFLTRTPEEVARYWSLAATADGTHLNAHVPEPRAGITRHVVVRRTDAEAIAIARRAWPVYQRNFGATPLRMPGGQVAHARTDAFDAVLGEGRGLLVGSAETVSTTLKHWLDRLDSHPSFYFAPAVQWGDITFDESLETVRVLAEEVMPSLRPSVASVH